MLNLAQKFEEARDRKKLKKQSAKPAELRRVFSHVPKAVRLPENAPAEILAEPWEVEFLQDPVTGGRLRLTNIRQRVPNLSPNMKLVQAEVDGKIKAYFHNGQPIPNTKKVVVNRYFYGISVSMIGRMATFEVEIGIKRRGERAYLFLDFHYNQEGADKKLPNLQELCLVPDGQYVIPGTDMGFSVRPIKPPKSVS